MGPSPFTPSIRQQAITWLLLLVGILLSGPSWANGTDSLLQRVATAPHDTARVDSYLFFSRKLFFQDREKCKDFVERAKTLAQEIGYHSGEASAWHFEGSLYLTQGATGLAMGSFLEGEKVSKAHNDLKGLAKSNLSIGNVLLMQKDYEEAIRYYQQGESFMVEIGDSNMLGVLRHNLAIAYDETGDSQKALEQFLDNLEFQQAVRIPHSVARTHASLGEVYRKLGDLDKALFHSRKALSQKRSLGEVSSLLPVYNQLAEFFLESGQLDSAGHYLTSGKTLCQDTQCDADHQLRNLMLLGRWHAQKGSYRQAYLYTDQYATEKDSLLLEQQNELALNLRNQYEVEKQDAEIQLLNSQAEVMEAQKELFQRENDQQRTFILALAITLILVLSGAILMVLLQKARRKASEQIEAQKSQIEMQLAELQAKNEQLHALHLDQQELVNMIAHDLKAPFTRSSALLDLVANANNLEPDQKQILNMVLHSNSQGKRMIEDMLTIRELENEPTEPWKEDLSLETFLANIARGHQEAARKKNIRLATELPQQEAILHTNPGYLERILDNLLSNAIKFSESDTVVSLACTRTEENFVFAVTDQGPGISDEDQEKMFGKFQRLSARPTGGESSSGLGLAVVKALVERLGGQIEVVSQLGNGTQFSVTLPA